MATLSADGNSATVNWGGGDGTFMAYGTFGGGTARLQFSPDSGTTWLNVGTDVTMTSDGIANFYVPSGLLRANLDGATGPTVTVKIIALVDASYVNQLE